MEVELKSFENTIITDSRAPFFVGFISETYFDFEGNLYKIKKESKKYLYIFEIFGKHMYVLEDYLIDTLLSEEIQTLKSGEIYEHGYPEGRLIPQNHYEDCNDCFLDSVKESFNEKIDRILRDYM